jgi:glycerol kinase
MKYILALDQGTTSSRAIVFDRDGRVVAMAQRELGQIYPRPGWVEHDPYELWQSQMETAVEALRRAGLAAGDIAACGITNQRETTLMWERATGRPVHNAIVWQDRRTAAFCDSVREEFGALVRERTGLETDAYFSASKIRWLLDNVPDARAKAENGEFCFGTVDSWLIWQLTNGRTHATDTSNASRTMLFDIARLDWDGDLLDRFAVPRQILPDVRSSSEVFAEIETPGELKGIPIAGIAGDQQAALFGQAAFSKGGTKCTYGTGCFLLQNVGERPAVSANRLLSTVGWTIGGRTEYALEGSVFIGGAVVGWLRDALGVIGDSADVERLAASVDDNGGVYFVPAFAGLGTPHWDQAARGLIVGLTRGTGRAHIARAALESIALQTADLLDAVHADSGVELAELRVDGGASRNDLLMQMQADMIQRPVLRPEVTETTALGAAYLAGLAVGFWGSTDEIAGQWKVEKRFDPQMPTGEVEKVRERWNEAVVRSLGWEK